MCEIDKDRILFIFKKTDPLLPLSTRTKRERVFRRTRDISCIVSDKDNYGRRAFRYNSYA